jgi:hypothetical protein
MVTNSVPLQLASFQVVTPYKTSLKLDKAEMNATKVTITSMMKIHWNLKFLEHLTVKHHFFMRPVRFNLQLILVIELKLKTANLVITFEQNYTFLDTTL